MLHSIFDIVEAEEKKSALTFLSLEAIFYARVLQSLKISCLLLNFLYNKEIWL